jgi:Abortive infection C-terminus
MVDESELPTSLAERAAMLEDLLTERATGGVNANKHVYEHLRREFMANASTKDLLPDFVRTSRTLDAFWPWIKNKAGSYADRRRLISEAFGPLADHLEGRDCAPGDNIVSTSLKSFDADAVHAVWLKALDRRTADPEGAITIARTLLETVCKRILDLTPEMKYSDREDLPKLYGMVAKALNLAPDQHSEEPIRAILGGAMTLVNGIGTLRNRLSDSHGRGGKTVRASPRHASLAVNLAGGVATFLVETFLARKNSSSKAR